MLDVAVVRACPWLMGFVCFAHQDAVHDHVGAGRKVLGRELVFGRNARNQRVGFAREFDLLALIQVGERNQDVVPGIELQRPCRPFLLL